MKIVLPCLLILIAGCSFPERQFDTLVTEGETGGMGGEATDFSGAGATGDGGGPAGSGGADGSGGANCTSGSVVTGQCGAACTPNTTQCSGNGVQTCDASGQWGPAVACGATVPHCSSGTCGLPPSCQSLAANCGSSAKDGCCNSPTVEGGTFFRGTTVNYPTSISTYALDKYEVTVGRFRKFLAAYNGPPTSGAGAHPLIIGSGWDTAWNTSIASSSAAMTAAVQCSAFQPWPNDATSDRLPMGCVSWFEAFAFCAWDGGRLPTEAEWEYAAAGGGEERTYPWGDEPAPSSTYAVYNYDCGAQAESCEFKEGVGSTPAGVGRYGQLDLAGSLYEWTLDWYLSPYATAACNNCANLSPSTVRAIRGGSWNLDDSSYLAAAVRDYDTPADHNFYMGFRCARTR